MNFKEISIKKVKNGFVITSVYDRILGERYKDRFVFNNAERVIEKIKELMKFK